jgi:hypothetical protein
MTNQPSELTLATLGGGDLAESVQLALRKIGENINDPNMKKDAKRKLTITIEIKPDSRAGMAAITYDVQTALPGQEAGRTAAYISIVPGTNEISLFEVERHPPLFEDPTVIIPELARKDA